MVVREVLQQDPSEVGLIKDDDVVEALPAYGSDELLDVGIRLSFGRLTFRRRTASCCRRARFSAARAAREIRSDRTTRNNIFKTPIPDLFHA